jgi:hypothetical protein
MDDMDRVDGMPPLTRLEETGALILAGRVEREPDRMDTVPGVQLPGHR